jgi:hypothetical protein
MTRPPELLDFFEQLESVEEGVAFSRTIAAKAWSRTPAGTVLVLQYKVSSDDHHMFVLMSSRPQLKHVQYTGWRAVVIQLGQLLLLRVEDSRHVSRTPEHI